MNIVKDNIIPLTIGSIIGAIGALILSIYSDVLPVVLPSLEKVPVTIYIKISILLILLLFLTVIIGVVYFLKSRSFTPRTLSGKEFGFEWSAKLGYRGEQGEVDVELQWLCPKHAVFLHTKSANVPETIYDNLFCPKCDHVYEMKSNGDSVYIQEAASIVRRKILGQIKNNG